MRQRNRFLSMVFVTCSLAAPNYVLAQDAAVVLPGDSALDPGRMVAFEAEYEQVGFPFFARLVRTDGNRPILSFQMTMEGPEGVGIDHVGHHADDLSFAYRRFNFGAFRPEYIDARMVEDSLRLRRLFLGDEGADPPTGDRTTALGQPVVDGTFAYWLAGALPLQEGYRWRWHTWQPTADGFEVRDTPVFTVTGREVISLESGERFDTWVIEVEGAASTVRMWVSEAAPYLVRQDVGPPGGEARTVISLVRVRSVGGDASSHGG